MIDFDNQTNIDINLAQLEEVAAFITPRDFELLLVDDQTIQELNHTHRGINKPTDVLSFPIEAYEHMPLGSIVISIDTARRKADELNHDVVDEVKLLLIHGLLHLLGYDHEIDDEMRCKEEEIIKHFNLPDSLIVRTQA